jgi:hypothetical protein
MMRISIARRLKKLEELAPETNLADPDTITIGRLSMSQVHCLLFQVEQDQFGFFLDNIVTANLSDEHFMAADRIIQVAHDRHDAGLRLAKERRTLAERYAELKCRQANGETIHYDAIPAYVEYLIGA